MSRIFSSPDWATYAMVSFPSRAALQWQKRCRSFHEADLRNYDKGHLYKPRPTTISFGTINGERTEKMDPQSLALLDRS